MSRQNRVRLAAWIGGLVVAGMVAGPATHAQQQSFFYTAPVNIAQSNAFGIDVGDILTAVAVYDPNALTGSGIEDLFVNGPGELSFTIEDLLFEGTDTTGAAPRVRFEDGVFDGILLYNNTVDQVPTGISLSTASGFAFDRPVDSTTEVFATGGPFSLAQASVN